VIRAVAAWAIAVASIGVYVVMPFLDPTTDLTAVVIFGAATASFVIVGLLLVGRAPGNRIGPLLVLTGVLLASAFAVSGYSVLGAAARPPWPAVGLAALVGDALYLYPIVLALIGIPLVFPDGCLISPRWRWVVVLVVVAMAAQTIQYVIDPDTVGAAAIDNPFGNEDLAWLARILGGFSSAVSVIGFGAGAAALWVRFRDGGPVERQQLKWLLAVAALAAVFFPIAFIVPNTTVNDVFFVLGVMTLIALPIAIAVAILRYRLFEIDRLISRSIAYLLITTILVAAYVGLVIVIGGPLADSRGGDTISVALSTLVVAALFQPLRRRVQGIVDRRFDRARIDADRTTAAFSERLRDEVDIATLTTDLRDTVRATVRPERLGIWLRETGR
jgi:hypothetical protein